MSVNKQSKNHYSILPLIRATVYSKKVLDKIEKWFSRKKICSSEL